MTENVAVCPAVTVWFAGCAVIVRGMGAGFTVNVVEPVTPFKVALMFEFPVPTPLARPAELIVVTRGDPELHATDEVKS